jgi:O-succinylbenzoate synthase
MNREIRLERFSRSFARPLTVGATAITAREGVYLYSADTAETSTPLAELSPLPAFSVESLADAIHQLELVLAGTAEPTLPSVRFALSCVEARGEISLTGAVAHRPLEVNELLSLATLSEQSAEQVNGVVKNVRARILKIKFPAIAAQMPTQLKTLKLLAAELPENIKFRIDFNGNLLKFPIKTLFEVVEPARIDYLEDPAFSVAELERLDVPFSIAADDLFLPAENRKRILENPKVKTVVLKPQQIGSYEDLESLVAQCQSSGKRVTLTSLLETEVGLRHCFLFAQRLRKRFELEPCGFLTLDLFESYEEIFEQTELGNAGLFVRLSVPSPGQTGSQRRSERQSFD